MEPVAVQYCLYIKLVHCVSIIGWFYTALHMLATEKLISCMTEILYDEHLFSHLIHEALSFHSDMLQLHEYPEDWPSCLHALTAEEPFSKWIVIEKKCESAVCMYIRMLSGSRGDESLKYNWK